MINAEALKPAESTKQVRIVRDGKKPVEITFRFDPFLLAHPGELDRRFWSPAFKAEEKELGHRKNGSIASANPSQRGLFAGNGDKYTVGNDAINTEIHYYWKLASEQGDTRAADIIGGTLLGVNMRLLTKIARENALREQVDPEEAFLSSLAGFTRALRNYDSTEGKFSDHMASWVRSAVQRDEMSRKHKGRESNLSLDWHTEESDFGDGQWRETHASTEDPAETVVKTLVTFGEEVDSLTEGFDDRDRDIFRRWLNGQIIRDIASEANVSEKTVQNRLKRVKDGLRTRLWPQVESPGMRDDEKAA